MNWYPFGGQSDNSPFGEVRTANAIDSKNVYRRIPKECCDLKPIN
jgi:hypothetical protein